MALSTVGRRATGDYYARASRGQSVRMSSDEVPTRFVRFVAPKAPGAAAQAPDRIYTVGYFFVANDAYLATPEHVRLKAFDILNRYAYYCKVEVVPGVLRKDPRTGRPYCLPTVEDEALARGYGLMGAAWLSGGANIAMGIVRIFPRASVGSTDPRQPWTTGSRR